MKRFLLMLIIFSLCAGCFLFIGCSKPAQFEVTSIDIPDEAVIATIPFDITATITNTGGTAGTYTAVLQVDGTELATKNITLDSGTTGTATFTTTLNKKNTYLIDINGKRATLEVSALPVSYAVLKKEDLSDEFDILPINELDMTVDDFTFLFSEYGGEANDYFGFMRGDSPSTFEMIYGIFIYPLSTSGKVSLNMELSDPDTVIADFIDSMSFGTGGDMDVELIPKLGNVGDKSIGIRAFLESDGIPMILDSLMFRTDDILTVLYVAWFDGYEPVITSDEIADIVEERIDTVVLSR